MDNQILVGIAAALIGLPALVAIVISILKYFGIVKDGDANTWSVLLNVIGLTGLYTWKLFDPTVLIPTVDEKLMILAKALGVLFSLFVQLKVSPAFYNSIRGIPLIGFSHSTPKK